MAFFRQKVLLQSFIGLFVGKYATNICATKFSGYIHDRPHYLSLNSFRQIQFWFIIDME